MNSILKYWFGFDRTLDELNHPDYKHLPELWFKISNETDNEIKVKFENVLTNLEHEDKEEWPSSLHGSLAVIVLYGQLVPCIHRGTSKMFAFNSKAAQLAHQLIDNETELLKLSSIEKYFVYSALLHEEDLKIAKIGLDGIKKLYEDEDSSAHASKHKEAYLKYFNSAKKNYGILAAYGRYPQRNELLKRESTKEEIVFLKKSQHSYAKSVRRAEEMNKTKNESTQSFKENDKVRLPTQNILFLHGFRQSANKIKKRLYFPLLKKLKLEANAQITLLNGTHPYKPNGKVDSALNMIESQRVWYNLHNETEWDESVETELNESLAHIFYNSNRVDGRPLYDGVIGFSQGAVVASILTNKYPNLFKYFISISGYQTTAPKYLNIYSQPIDSIPSMHIFGLNDKMVEPIRSEALSKWFVNSQIQTHKAGHFAPDSWPVNAMAKFIAEQSKHVKPTLKSFNQLISSSSSVGLLRLNVHEINYNLMRFDLNELDLKAMFLSPQAADLFELIKNNEQPFTKNVLLKTTLSQEIKKSFNLTDKLLLVYYLMLKNKSKQSKDFQNFDRSDEDETIKSALLVWSLLYTELIDRNILNDSIEVMFIESGHWHELIYLCDLAYQSNLTHLFELIITKLTQQLITDLIAMDRKRNTHNFQALVSNLTDIPSIAEEINAKLNELAKNDEEILLSKLSFYFPRVKSSLDKRSRIARTVAYRLNAFKDAPEDMKSKILSYNRLRKILTILTHYIKTFTNPMDTNPRVHFNMARTNKSVLKSMVNADVFSDAIINPVPEPVDVSSRDQMQPLYHWLKQSSTPLMKLTEHDLKFLKGTVTLDGRLDLCKQVIGPQGVEPLLESMQNSKYVDRLLLGNNVVGDEGAKLIADFISSGKSPITIWYIAGNNITSIGMEKIVKSLLNDTQVTALWLKRNPLKAAGMIPISELLLHNKNIQVLDLLNCGLMDVGATVLFEGLKSNKHLKHLYLSANGITPVGLKPMLDYFKTVGNSQLESLFLGCNRIGNEGAKLVGECLKYATKLERLNLSSSRIGPLGMKYLCDSLNGNRTVKLVDLGYMKATMDLGELNNFIEDEGVGYLTQLLASNSTNLISVNISHNHVSQSGFEMLVNMGVKENKSLIFLNYGQFGVHFDADLIGLLKIYLNRNRDLFLSTNSESDLDDIVLPEHVKEIYSVYRTH